MSDLEAAIDIALDAHSDQTDKAHKPYIRHPLRLMERMDTNQERIVAVLHDVAEDSEYTLRDIQREFGEDVRTAVEALTKADGEDYLNEYIPRLVENSTARKVKRADLNDNLDVTRLPDVGDGELKNIEKYHKALQKVNSASEEQS
jgi:GTP pyrophosphokinase